MIRKFARNGSGPDELKGAFFAWRCGPQMFVMENQRGVSVFTLDGSFVRKFQFNNAFSKLGSYRTACNQNAKFVHYGWDDDKDHKPGISYRSRVHFHA